MTDFATSDPQRRKPRDTHQLDASIAVKVTQQQRLKLQRLATETTGGSVSALLRFIVLNHLESGKTVPNFRFRQHRPRLAPVRSRAESLASLHLLSKASALIEETLEKVLEQCQAASAMELDTNIVDRLTQIDAALTEIAKSLTR